MFKYLMPAQTGVLGVWHFDGNSWAALAVGVTIALVSLWRALDKDASYRLLDSISNRTRDRAQDGARVQRIRIASLPVFIFSLFFIWEVVASAIH